MIADHCGLCGRPAPPRDSPERADWHAIKLDTVTKDVCPDCSVDIAVESGQALAEQLRDAAVATEQTAAVVDDEASATQMRETAQRLRQNARAMEEAAADVQRPQRGES